jgi:flagellar motor component MotA
MAIEIKELEQALLAQLGTENIEAATFEQISKVYQKANTSNVILDFSNQSTLEKSTIKFLQNLSEEAKFENGLIITIIKNNANKDFQNEIPEVVILGTEHEAIEAIMMHELEKQFKAEMGEI